MTESATNGPEPGLPTSTKPARKRRGREQNRRLFQRVSAVVLGALFLTGAGASWLLYQGQQVKTNLEAGAQLVPGLKAQAASATGRADERTLSLLQGHTAKARAAATDPLWKAASVLPLFGANFSAVSEVAIASDDVVTRAITPLFRQSQSLRWTALAPKEGRIDSTVLAEAAPSLTAAANTVQLSYDRLSGIDHSKLLPAVSEPLRLTTDTLGEARVALNGASSTAKLLPAMLGAKGQRNYLLLLQNSAEIRATGGIPGALAIISADDGRIKLTAQSSAGDLGLFRPPLAVDKEQERIYSRRLGTQMQNVNLTPDFPTAAQTARAMWEQRNPSVKIDGVIALDPEVLAKLLGATGPINLNPSDVGTDGTETDLPLSLDNKNVVSTLLSKSYSSIGNPALQDEYFAGVARAVFDAMVSGRGNSAKLVEALTASSQERRLYMWSAFAEEQKVLSTTSLAGAATGPSAGGAAFGLYFNDGTGAKMDYYVQRKAQLVQTCTGDGYSTFTLKVTLTNTASPEEISALPKYVTGGGVFGVPPGTVRTNTIAYGPAQARLGSAKVNGKPVPLGSFLHANRPVGVITSELAPGKTVTIEIGFAKVVQSSEPRLDITPTIQSPSEVIQPLLRAGTCTPVS